MTTPLTPAEIANMEALLAAASAGEWSLGDAPYFSVTSKDGTPIEKSWFKQDATFIVAAHNIMPRLIAEWRQMKIESLKAELAALNPPSDERIKQ